MPAELNFDADAAINRLMQFLAVEGVTGKEEAIAADVAKALGQVGVPASAILYDGARNVSPCLRRRVT